MAVNITDEQLGEMIRITEEVVLRLPGLGMPELDAEVKEMLDIMKEAATTAPTKHTKEAAEEHRHNKHKK